ncbi:MAG: rhodanese-like domain-containing protein [Clostridia bacterium]|nr:rhodanese-like domain-containing protein [Clostridia bacterium]
MKKLIMIFLTFGVLGLSACGVTKNDESTTIQAYISVSGKEAKQIMEKEKNYIILDVRTQEEFDAGHISGAVLIPDYEIQQRAQKELTDKNQLILVYCRSGRRSKLASQVLADMGYTNVVEFGGINDWEYETQK